MADQGLVEDPFDRVEVVDTPFGDAVHLRPIGGRLHAGEHPTEDGASSGGTATQCDLDALEQLFLRAGMNFFLGLPGCETKRTTVTDNRHLGQTFLAQQFARSIGMAGFVVCGCFIWRRRRITNLHFVVADDIGEIC